MLIFKQEKIICHLGDSRTVDVLEGSGEKPYRNYAVFFTLQVNGTLKDIRTVLGVTKGGTYIQDSFVAVENTLKDLGYDIPGKNLSKIYDQVKYERNDSIIKD